MSLHSPVLLRRLAPILPLLSLLTLSLDFRGCLALTPHGISSRALAPLDDYGDGDGSNVAKSRKKRSIIFPTGSDLEFTVAFQIPIAAWSATSE